MSEFKFSCPHCDQHLQCDDQFAGRQITCPACKVLMRIPPAPGKTAAYQPESGQTWNTHIPAGRPSPLQRTPPAPKPDPKG